MYFSKSKAVKRCFSLISVLLLATMLFAGCKKAEADVPTTEGKLDLNLDLEPTTQTQPLETETQPTETTTVISEKTGTVVSQLNVRMAPSTYGSTVVGTLYPGDRITVERRENLVGIEWAYISSPQTGWICMDFVEMDIPDADIDSNKTPGETAPTTEGSGNTANQGQATNSSQIKGVVTTGLNIRKEPGTTATKVGAYAKGDVVTILEVKDGWGRTSKGWIKMEYVNTTGSSTGSTGNTGSTGGNTTVSGNGSSTVQFKGVVRANELNIRSTASTTGTRLGSYTAGTRVSFYEKDGNWGRTDKGWICLDYVYQDGTTGVKTATGTVTGNGLRVRSGPGTKYDVVSSLSAGDKVNILEQFTIGDTTWGAIKNGWISMDYVDTGSGSTGGSSSGNTSNNDSFTATITGNGVNIRSGAGTNYETVGTLNKGDSITVTELKIVGGREWGRIKQGWVCMDYAKVD